MVEKAAGMRVYAVQDSDESQVNLIGFGVYQGLQPVYGNLRPSNADHRKAERDIRKHDEKPIDVAAVLRAKRSYMLSDDEINERDRVYKERHEQEKALPMEERVRLRLMERENKPCIYLDSGFIVWGFDVLWGPEKRWERYRRGRTVVEVPPPYGAERWRETPEGETNDHNAGGTPASDRQAPNEAGTTGPA